MSGGAQYVVAAYAVIWVLILAYVVMLGARTARVSRQVEVLSRLIDRESAPDGTGDAAEEDTP